MVTVDDKIVSTKQCELSTVKISVLGSGTGAGIVVPKVALCHNL